MEEQPDCEEHRLAKSANRRRRRDTEYRHSLMRHSTGMTGPSAHKRAATPSIAVHISPRVRVRTATAHNRSPSGLGDIIFLQRSTSWQRGSRAPGCEKEDRIAKRLYTIHNTSRSGVRVRKSELLPPLKELSVSSCPAPACTSEWHGSTCVEYASRPLSTPKSINRNGIISLDSLCLPPHMPSSRESSRSPHTRRASRSLRFPEA